MALVALGLCAGAVVELTASRRRPAGDRPSGRERDDPIGPAGEGPAGQALRVAVDRLGVSRRLARAGLDERISVRSVLAAKLAGAVAGLLAGGLAVPAAPGRLAPLVLAGLPVAGFFGIDAWLERRARRRLAELRAGLPDALELLSVGAASGRSPIDGLAELAAGESELQRELSVLAAEVACGAPERAALRGLRSRAPLQEVAGMCAAIERSRRYGSPLADQLRDQAASLRAGQSRRISEQAARAAPKIQLAVALLLVPSVLMLIAAGLLANLDRFLAGF